MFSEGNADSLLQILRLFGLLQICKKVRLTTITICRGLSHTTRSLSRIVLRGQFGTLRPILQTQDFFLKQMSPQDTVRQQYSQLNNFELMMSEYFQDRRESPLMNSQTLKIFVVLQEVHHAFKEVYQGSARYLGKNKKKKV